MSTSNSTTVYQIVFVGPYGGFQANFTTNDGWTDEFALQVQAALNTLTWPTNNTGTVYKITTDQTQYTADTATNPAVFD